MYTQQENSVGKIFRFRLTEIIFLQVQTVSLTTEWSVLQKKAFAADSCSGLLMRLALSGKLKSRKYDFAFVSEVRTPDIRPDGLSERKTLLVIQRLAKLADACY